MKLSMRIRNWWRRQFGKSQTWTAQDLYDWTCNLDDNKFKDLVDCHIFVIGNMLRDLPDEPAYDNDREVLKWLLGQIENLPGPRITTLAAIECERIRLTGVFDQYVWNQDR